MTPREEFIMIFEGTRELLLSSAHGQFIPQLCADIKWIDNGLQEWDRHQLKRGPEGKFYWDAWESSLERIFKRDGEYFCLEQDEDLYAVNITSREALVENWIKKYPEEDEQIEYDNINR